MAGRYPDKSWRQNQLSKLVPEEGASSITRSIYDRWDRQTGNVFKAMKIGFVPKMAQNLEFDNGRFGAIITATPVDDPTTPAFKKRVCKLAVDAGYQFADPQDTAHPQADVRYVRNYAEITEILDDFVVQLSTSVTDKKLELCFKTEHETDHPLMALRILRRI
jgi:hypothetical protein